MKIYLILIGVLLCMQLFIPLAIKSQDVNEYLINCNLELLYPEIAINNPPLKLYYSNSENCGKHFKVFSNKDTLRIDLSQIIGGLNYNGNYVIYVDNNRELHLYDENLKLTFSYKIDTKFEIGDALFTEKLDENILISNAESNWYMVINDVGKEQFYEILKDPNLQFHSNLDFQKRDNEIFINISSDGLPYNKTFKYLNDGRKWDKIGEFTLPFTIGHNSVIYEKDHFFYRNHYSLLITNNKGEILNEFNDFIWSSVWEPITGRENIVFLVMSSKDYSQQFLSINRLNLEDFEVIKTNEFLESYNLKAAFTISDIKKHGDFWSLLLCEGSKPKTFESNYMVLTVDSELKEINKYELGYMEDKKPPVWDKSVSKFKRQYYKK